MSSYLKKLDVPVEVANDNQREEAFRKKAAELITIKDIPALWKLPLSHSGQLAGISKSNYCRTVVNALKNLRGRQLKDVPAENILITCAKDGWHKKGNVDVAGPFASGSKLFQGANWVPKITRGTNVYAHCTHPIYLYDQYMNPLVARWLEEDKGAFEEQYALPELIQWVWRSRVRKGQPITLYLPSPRMRQLMEGWLSD